MKSLEHLHNLALAQRTTLAGALPITHAIRGCESTGEAGQIERHPWLRFEVQRPDRGQCFSLRELPLKMEDNPQTEHSWQFTQFKEPMLASLASYQ
jgi:hypothetical protein